GDYQDIHEYDREYSDYHSETDNEALYMDIKIYNEALVEGIEIVDEAQPEDTNEEMYDNDSEGEEQEKILVLNTKMQFDISSRLADIVDKIQKILDNRSKKTILSEFKTEILTREMPNITDEYFLGLDKVLQEYLITKIFQKQHDQIAQSLCYDNFIKEAKDNLFSTQNNVKDILVGDPLHIPHKGRQTNRYKSSSEPLKKVRRKAPANEDGEEMRQKIQNTTETSSNNQVSVLQDLEKKIR
ncbi:9125_t:CDS:2, partial [Racocetra fulgida]